MSDEMTATTSAATQDPRLHRGWATIDGDWNRFYKEFAGVYDRFTVSTSLLVDEMQSIADFTGTQVLSLASGTGRDAFEVARRAKHVIGIEPWMEMRSFAIAKQQRLGIQNVEFVDGVAEDLSRFEDGVFDRVISVHGAPFPWDDAAFVRGCLRVLRPGGYVLFGGTIGVSKGVGSAPGSGTKGTMRRRCWSRSASASTSGQQTSSSAQSRKPSQPGALSMEKRRSTTC